MENSAVDVTELTRSIESTIDAKDDPDETECSSSFADTASGNENCSGLSDTEVESQFYVDSDLASPFDGFSSVFPMRKKKLTSHWRNFIRPLMWRCKWAELRIKAFKSQASKYSRILEAYDRKKHVPEKCTVDEFWSKSLPFTFQGKRKKALKRRKRKKIEDTTDITSYMSNHNLFSYRENKKFDTDGNFAEDFGSQVLTEQNVTGQDEFDINHDSLLLGEDDNFLEQILQKIELVHDRVHKMKGQLDLVMTKNAGKFSSSENLSRLVPWDAQNSSVPSPTFSACNGDTVSLGGLYTPSQHLMEYDFGDFMLPDSAVSSYGEAIIPDIIESTVGLLSSLDVTQQQAQIGDSSEKIVDNILIHNEMAEVEGQAFESNYNQSAEKHHEAENSGEEESTNPHFQQLETSAVGTNSISQEQSMLKSCLASGIHFPKNKRKRGERKAGSGGWSRQCPGEPDSQ